MLGRTQLLTSYDTMIIVWPLAPKEGSSIINHDQSTKAPRIQSNPTLDLDIVSTSEMHTVGWH